MSAARHCPRWIRPKPGDDSVVPSGTGSKIVGTGEKWSHGFVYREAKRGGRSPVGGPWHRCVHLPRAVWRKFSLCGVLRWCMWEALAGFRAVQCPANARSGRHGSGGCTTECSPIHGRYLRCESDVCCSPGVRVISDVEGLSGVGAGISSLLAHPLGVSFARFPGQGGQEEYSPEQH